MGVARISADKWPERDNKKQEETTAVRKKVERLSQSLEV